MKPAILIHGSRGRMGQAIKAAALEADFPISGEIDQGDDINSVISGCAAVIDFSIHHATAAVAAAAAEHGKALVIGTTGHNEEEKKQILSHTTRIPVVWAGNYSVGVNTLFYLVRKAAAILDAEYQPEIVEMHHRHKVDAPSGTAARLLEILLQQRGLDDNDVTHGRHGLTGARPQRQIGMHALRGGDVVGDHTVIFAGEGERLELTHKASNRSIFAHGALRAAAWAVNQQPGLYRMEDVLGLSGD